MSIRARLAFTRLVKVHGEHRWKAVPAYIQQACQPAEIAALFHRLEHDWAKSADPAADLKARYRAASAASLVLATVVLRASDFETVPQQDPKGTFDALPNLFGPEGREPADIFLSHHRKSRRGAGGRPALAGALRDLSRAVDRFRISVLEWLDATRRNLLPARPPPDDDPEPRQRTLF